MKDWDEETKSLTILADRKNDPQIFLIGVSYFCSNMFTKVFLFNQFLKNKEIKTAMVSSNKISQKTIIKNA